MKKKMMVLTGLLMAVFITAYSVSGTYAKYTSTFTGSSSVTVAKWAFTFGKDGDQADFDFDLFSTILDTSENGVNADGTDQDVVEGKIAPGTTGSFDVGIMNKSEVSARVTMTAEVDNTVTVTDEEGNETTLVIPIEYSLTGTQGSWVSDINTILTTISRDMLLNSGANNVSQTIYWRWAFNDSDVSGKDDAQDTALGILAATGTAPEVTVTLNLTAEQID